jgi:hypothetical protein
VVLVPNTIRHTELGDVRGRVCDISIRTSTAALSVSRLTKHSTIDLLLFDMLRSHHWKLKASGLP